MPTIPPRRRWFRFSLRMLLVMVTLVALGSCLWVRADLAEKRAMWHEEEALSFSLSAKIADLSGFPKNPTSERRSEERQRSDQAKAEYHESMAAKCRLSVWRPWIHLGPDPKP